MNTKEMIETIHKAFKRAMELKDEKQALKLSRMILSLGIQSNKTEFKRTKYERLQGYYKYSLKYLNS